MAKNQTGPRALEERKKGASTAPSVEIDIMEELTFTETELSVEKMESTELSDIFLI